MSAGRARVRNFTMTNDLKMEVVMKKMAMTMMAGALAFLLVPPTVDAAGVKSLRGDQEIDKESVRPGRARPEEVRGGFERTWKEQPPMIPHDISKDRITLQNNGCLKCHSKENYEKEEAPMIGESHFIARDGSKLEHVSQRRWFCNQCHAPQLSARPLVENTFKGRK